MDADHWRLGLQVLGFALQLHLYLRALNRKPETK